MGWWIWGDSVGGEGGVWGDVMEEECKELEMVVWNRDMERLSLVYLV